MTEASDRKYRVERQPEGYCSVTPMPTKDELRAFYADVYYQDLPSTSYQAFYDEEERAYIDLRSQQILYALAEAGVPGPGQRLLEIGVGEGFFMKAADQAGFAVEGVDFSAYGVEAFNPELAPLVRTGDAYDLLDELTREGQGRDAVVLQNVLEHVIDPTGLLLSIARLLAPGGCAVIKVPNDYSRLQTSALERGLVAGPFWFAPPQHLHYFPAESLTALCEAQGFEVCDLYADFPVDWFLFHAGSNYVADPTRGKAAHRARIAIDLLMSEAGIGRYQDFCRALAGVGMGRDLTVLARRAGSHGA